MSFDWSFLSQWLSALVSIVVIVDPVGNVPFFLAVTADESERDRKIIALRATIVAFGVLGFFILGGDFLLRFLGVTVDAFRVAGGIILMLVALHMLQAKTVRNKTSEKEKQ